LGNRAPILSVQKINPETGELIYSRDSRGVDYFNDDGYLFMINKNGARIFQYIDLPEGFSDSEVGKVFKLKNYIQQKTNMLYKRSSSGYTPMDREDIVKALGYESRRGITFFNRLIEKEILAQVTIKCGEDPDRVQYYINPLYFHGGKRINVNLYMLFKTQLDPYLKDWVRKKFTQQQAEIEKTGDADA